MVFDTNNKHVQKGTSSEISFKTMFANSTTCMEFWYHMPNQKAELSVFLRDQTGSHKLLWSGRGPTYSWSKATIQIFVTGYFQVGTFSETANNIPTHVLFFMSSDLTNRIFTAGT